MATTTPIFNGHEIDWAKFQRLSMRQAIIDYWPENAGAKPEMSDFSTADSLQAMVRRYNAQTPHIPYDPSAPAGKNHRRDLRVCRRAASGPANFHLRLPAGHLAAVEEQARAGRECRLGRAL